MGCLLKGGVGRPRCGRLFLGLQPAFNGGVCSVGHSLLPWKQKVGGLTYFAQPAGPDRMFLRCVVLWCWNSRFCWSM